MGRAAIFVLILTLSLTLPAQQWRAPSGTCETGRHSIGSMNLLAFILLRGISD
jgi:hypothetical protein